MDGRPTICHVLHGLGVGGAEVLAARLARRFADTYRPVFICLDDRGLLGEELAADGFGVHVLGRRPGVDGRCAYCLARLLRRERVDLVHGHQYTPFFYAALARLLAGRLPVLFTEHGRHFPDFPRRKRMLVNRLLLNRSDRVVAVGAATRQALIDNEGIPARRVEVIYNGIPLSGGTSRKMGAEVRRELGIPADALLILQVARLDALKDHATALAALARVIPQEPTVRLIVAGAGPLRLQIEQQVRHLGLTAHVQLLGTRRDVGRLLAAADIMLLTSRSEGIPLTLLEGMAARLPIVATRVGGVEEVVVDGKTGLLAAAGDVPALADAVVRLAAAAPLRRQMGLHARRRVEDVFSEERMCRQYDSLYRAMISGPRHEAVDRFPVAVGG